MSGATEAFTSAGSRIFIALAAPATFDAAGYAALSWVEIGEVTDIPEYGKEYQLVKFNPLKDKRTRKKKGSYDEGAVTLGMAKVAGDPGHQDLNTAVDDTDPASFKVVYPDGTIEYFQALVMSYKSNIGSVDNITMASAQLEIDSDVVQVLP
jgi:hypothetical protein